MNRVNRLAAVSLVAAAIAAGACASADAPTGPDAGVRAVIAGGPNLAKSACPKPAPRPSREVQLLSLPLSPVPVSIVGVIQTNVQFTNATCETLEMYWVRLNGEQVFKGLLQPGDNNRQITYVGHVWLIVRAHTEPYGIFRIEDYAPFMQEVYLGCAKGRITVCN